MLETQSRQSAQVTARRFAVMDIRRTDDWLVRECPDCHQQGYVSIYPNREAAAVNFITRPDWLCKSCADIRCEVGRNFFGLGGDAIGD